MIAKTVIRFGTGPNQQRRHGSICPHRLGRFRVQTERIIRCACDNWLNIRGRHVMSDWLHELPLRWMAVVLFGSTFAATAVIYAVVIILAGRETSRSFKAVSPGLLPPLGIIFGLFVAFTAAQVWNDNERAQTAVNREASSLRSVVLLSSIFSSDSEGQLRTLVRDYIEETATTEWPMLAREAATLGFTPPALLTALRYTLGLVPVTEGQKIAQREIATAIENALDARRQRILISRSEVNPVKWVCLLLQAACALVAVAMVHSDNRVTSGITMTLFAIGIAASLLLILAHDRPFVGEVSVGPGPLLQVMPAPDKSQSSEMDCGSAFRHSRRLAMRDVDISGHNPATIFSCSNHAATSASFFRMGSRESRC